MCTGEGSHSDEPRVSLILCLIGNLKTVIFRIQSQTMVHLRVGESIYAVNRLVIIAFNIHGLIREESGFSHLKGSCALWTIWIYFQQLRARVTLHSQMIAKSGTRNLQNSRSDETGYYTGFSWKQRSFAHLKQVLRQMVRFGFFFFSQSFKLS